ncbi:MAG: hypothetical protein EZS28_017030 [Streblomastix strix]|uniref:Uncharacterized protein n=1 Tax=Streblomastix strix TaxID=222440 RepID=A0A5J4VXR2_9EUKA|nr:MAG: hypothetical protein EZS28_017030 [Streblomastix strix]
MTFAADEESLQGFAMADKRIFMSPPFIQSIRKGDDQDNSSSGSEHVTHVAANCRDWKEELSSALLTVNASVFGMKQWNQSDKIRQCQLYVLYPFIYITEIKDSDTNQVIFGDSLQDRKVIMTSYAPDPFGIAFGLPVAVLPYATLDLIVNDKNILTNVQYIDPSVIEYDFDIQKQ